MRWLVDGMNVIGARPDGWWRDRAGAARRLAAALRQLAADRGEHITVAFEGTQVPELPRGGHDGLTVLYARRRGANAADDRIVEVVAADPDPASLSVVTSDRDLARRVRDLGAVVVSPSVLLRQLRATPEGRDEGREGGAG
jgi:predicted RNA-binding protein with PIN domain